ncbi:NHL repeat-containing protein, partial [Mucilaginibacter sp. OK098]
MRNLYSSLAAATAAKQLKQTVGQASMCFAKTLLVIMVMITAAPVKLFAQLPTLSYSTPQTYTVGTAVTLAPTSSGVAGYGYSTSATTLASGFNVPMGIATDAAGNVYVADKGNMLVKKTPAGGGTPTTIGSGFTGPTGVAVDPFGNIWVTDSGDLKEVPAGGGAIITTSIGDAVAVAVDSKGNVFVLETSQGIGAITEYPVGGGPGIVIS